MSLLGGVVVAVTTIAARLSAGSTGDSSGSGVVEGDANLQSVVLLRSIATWQRLDVLPFVCLYAAAALDVVVSLRLGDRAMAFALVSAALHAMCVLVQQWFPLARCAVGFSSVASLADATFVLVTPREHKGVSSICARITKAIIIVEDERADDGVDGGERSHEQGRQLRTELRASSTCPPTTGTTRG